MSRKQARQAKRMTRRKRIVTATFATMFGVLALAMHAAPDEPRELPACATDEAESTYECKWDADTQGNGQGTSFTLTDPDGDGYADHVTYTD